jgi:SAM-dependent methyltransferase
VAWNDSETQANGVRVIEDSASAILYYKSRFVHDHRRRGVWRVVCRYLQSHVPRNGRALDLGAGYCDFINNIEAAEKHAIDLFPGFAEFADDDVHTHVGNCADLARFTDAYFDTVFESNVFEHLKGPALSQTLSEIFRVLRPGGRFIAVQPNFRYCYRTYFDDYTHVQVFTHVSLADLITSAGFDVERIEPRFLPTSFKTRLPAWPWLTALYLRLPFRPLAGQMLIISRLNTSK